MEQIWATLDPVLYESVEAAVEATRSVAHMLVAHDGSRNLFDEVPQLMNGFETMQMVNVTREAEALQSMTSMLTVAMIQQLVGGSKVLLHAAAIGDPATKRAVRRFHLADPRERIPAEPARREPLLDGKRSARVCPQRSLRNVEAGGSFVHPRSVGKGCDPQAGSVRFGGVRRGIRSWFRQLGSLRSARCIERRVLRSAARSGPT